MATTQLGNSSSASRVINYVEKRAVEKSGLNCDVDYAKSNFKQLRMLYGKNDGVQAHTVIQSFKPGEITSEKANEIGLELAKEIAPGHQVGIYTHDDKEHIHNHIIINSVNLEDGKKYQSNAKQRHLVRNKSDEICLNHGLSVIKEKDKIKKVRYTLAELNILKKGQRSWKEEIRNAINRAKAESHDFESLKKTLKNKENIEMKMKGNTFSYKHPEQKKYVRGKTLGYDFEKGGLEYEFQFGRDNTKSEEWEEFGREIEQSRPREESKEHADTKQYADGKTATAIKPDGKDIGNERDTAHDTREESSRTSEETPETNPVERKRPRERDEGMEM